MAGAFGPGVMASADIAMATAEQFKDATQRYSVGYGHTVLIDGTGQAWSFGSNIEGQLGLGDYAHRTPTRTPTPIPDFNLSGTYIKPLRARVSSSQIEASDKEKRRDPEADADVEADGDEIRDGICNRKKDT